MMIRRMHFFLSVIAVLTLGRGTCSNAGAHSVVRRDTTPDAPDKWKITTVAHPPYTFYNASSEPKFTGFIPDLLTSMAKAMGFKYQMTMVKDGRFGARGDDGNWNGMIGEIISGEADMAAAGITITKAREEVVDFVMPFHQLGLTLLIQKPYLSDNDDTEWTYNFSIFSPLTAPVWAIATLAMVVVALLLWLMNMFNPYDYGSRLHRGLATEEEAESFQLTGAFWYAFTTLQWQGFDRSPRSISSKVLSMFWFAFVTVTLVTYTAGVGNHLFWASTVHGKDPTQAPFKDLEHLVMSTDYKYGTVSGGSTYNYLMEVGRGDEFDRIRSYLQSKEGQTMLVDTLAKGVEKVRKEKYAFIMETMSAKHEVNNPSSGVCDLMTVGPQFAQRSYGFAIQQGSPHIETFHQGVLHMIETGELDYLEEKWWVNRGKCWNATRIERAISSLTSMDVNTPKRVNLSMFAGPLVLMLVGIILSILIFGGELAYYKYKGRYESSNRPRGQKLANDEEPNM